VRPVTVASDDPSYGLVAWLASGSPVIRPVAKDGREIRDVPLPERFSATTGRMPRRSTWHGCGTLLIAPRGRPWSVWLFWRPEWQFDSWYVNLEDVHRREAGGVITRDHVLDLVVQPDHSLGIKDEDELAAAIAACWVTSAEATSWRRDLDEAAAAIQRWESPFRDPWPGWRPNAAWPVPGLPSEPPR
jgi:hypothetical protein